MQCTLIIKVQKVCVCVYLSNSRILLTSAPLFHVVGKVVPGKRRVWKAPENPQAIAPVMSGRVNDYCRINKKTCFECLKCCSETD